MLSLTSLVYTVTTLFSGAAVATSYCSRDYYIMRTKRAKRTSHPQVLFLVELAIRFLFVFHAALSHTAFLVHLLQVFLLHKFHLEDFEGEPPLDPAIRRRLQARKSSPSQEEDSSTATPAARLFSQHTKVVSATEAQTTAPGDEEETVACSDENSVETSETASEKQEKEADEGGDEGAPPANDDEDVFDGFDA